MIKIWISVTEFRLAVINLKVYEDACDVIRRRLGILCNTEDERYNLLIYLRDSGFFMGGAARSHIRRYEAGEYDDMDYPYIKLYGTGVIIGVSRCSESQYVNYSDCYIGQNDEEITCDVNIVELLK